MFALPGIVFLLIVTLFRPHEFVESLADVPALHIALAIAAVGLAVDAGLGKATTKFTPVTGWAVAFLVWNALNLVLIGSTSPELFLALVTSCLVCLIVAHATVTPDNLRVVGGAFLVASLVLAVLGIHQGLSRMECLVVPEDGRRTNASDTDGRSCGTRDDCYGYGAAPGQRYACEHVGALGTTSVGGGRVRYRGILEDPNELALTVTLGLPISFALRREGGGLSRWALVLVTMLAVVVCVIFTRSRGGQLVVLAVLGCYFVVRTGMRGAITAAIIALPVLMYGGREGASGSTNERIDCWLQGMRLLRENPVFGVGYENMTDYAAQTAHSAYLQAAAEGGLPSMLLLCGLIYAACKIPWTALKRYSRPDDPRRAWAIALLACLVGLSVGIFFLSFAYHMILWLVVGLAGAFHGVLRRSDKGYSLKWGAKDYLAIGGGTFGILVLVYVLTRLAG